MSTYHNKNSIIDKQGFRLNIGIIVINGAKELLWAQRCNQQAWQFPQGGVQENESLDQAMYRELYEELGLKEEDVKILDSTPSLLRYRLPSKLIRQDQRPLCIGQKQKWYLLELISPDENVNLNVFPKPEFQKWEWVPYWYPLRYVISFKREVYRKALRYFAKQIFQEHPSGQKQKIENFVISIKNDKKH